MLAVFRKLRAPLVALLLVTSALAEKNLGLTFNWKTWTETCLLL